ncbi:hypothetical protein KY289_003334 [Solanum tuberosum]|nr:hypothetical protein KY289_003334 [Solanum tuberosum]
MKWLRTMRSHVQILDTRYPVELVEISVLIQSAKRVLELSAALCSIRVSCGMWEPFHENALLLFELSGKYYYLLSSVSNIAPLCYQEDETLLIESFCAPGLVRDKTQVRFVLGKLRVVSAPLYLGELDGCLLLGTLFCTKEIVYLVRKLGMSSRASMISNCSVVPE